MLTIMVPDSKTRTRSQKQVREYFARIHTHELFETEYIETALEFCRKQKLKTMISQLNSLASSFDEISKVINDALKLGSENNLATTLLQTSKKDTSLSSKPRYCGWSKMDNICGGGLGKSELGVVIAPTGAGKSMALVHLGSEGVKEGKTVVYYTLELQDTVVANRFDSCITGFPLSNLMDHKDDIFEQIRILMGL